MNARTMIAGLAGAALLAYRKLGMHVGVDVARGPEDTHSYMTFGSAWN